MNSLQQPHEVRLRGLQPVVMPGSPARDESQADFVFLLLRIYSPSSVGRR